MTDTGVIVRLHLKPPAVAQVVGLHIEKGSVMVRLWQRPSGIHGCRWARLPRALAACAVIREATPRELATGRVIEDMPPDTEEARAVRSRFEIDQRKPTLGWKKGRALTRKPPG